MTLPLIVIPARGLLKYSHMRGYVIARSPAIRRDDVAILLMLREIIDV
jgi:hypothetical protein